MKKCVFAGTFDPFTKGHADTVEKCLALFDEVIVAVAENKRKQCMFSVEERVGMIRAVYEGRPAVRILSWDGVIVDLLEREKTPFYVRGIRNTVDFEYETEDFDASRDLSSNFIEIYFPAERGDRYISSTLVKNCILFGKPYEAYLPPEAYRYIRKKEELCLKNK